MPEDIKHEAEKRGITRLCHFTSSQNFIHIQQSRKLKDRKSLQHDTNPAFNPTDVLRLDGHLDKLCCSVEYPNAFYLDKARAKNIVFHDWIILFLIPDLLWRPGALFCKRNAATQHGALLKPGIDGFRELFANRVEGAYDKTFTRSLRQLDATPTDVQAEVLVPGPIDIEHVLGIGVQSREQGQTERARWRTLNLPPWEAPIHVVPTLFNKYALCGTIQSGHRPDEPFLTEA